MPGQPTGSSGSPRVSAHIWNCCGNARLARSRPTSLPSWPSLSRSLWISSTLPPDFDPGATVTFTVDGRFPINEGAVQEFWANENDPASQGGPVMQCIVCGRQRAVLSRLPGKIKGVRGGQSSGTPVISANAPAFESYGLSESLVAPTLRRVARGLHRGANRLLGRRCHARRRRSDDLHLLDATADHVLYPRHRSSARAPTLCAT